MTIRCWTVAALCSCLHGCSTPSPHVEAGPPAAPASAGVVPPGSVLVLDLRATGIPESRLAAMTQRIAALIAERPGFSVVTVADIKDVLAHEQQRMAMGCESNAACLARVSELANSETVVTGSVGRVGRQIVINLSLLDGRRARAVSKVSATASRPDEVPAVLAGLVADLFGWSGKGRVGPPFRLARRNKPTSFAVFPLEAAGVDGDVAKNLTEVLSSAIKQVPGTTVVSMSDVVAMLQLAADKAKLGCADDISCVAEIGGALGVDKLVVGNIGKLSETHVVSLRLIDAKRTRVDNRVTESLRGPEDQLIRAMRFAARELLGVQVNGTGSLALSGDQHRAKVIVDGELEGMLPMPPIDDLAAGRHTVRLSKSGFVDWESDFFVDPGEATPVWATLMELPRPWYEKWWVWTIVGATVVAGGLTTYLLLEGGPPPTDGGNHRLP